MKTKCNGYDNCHIKFVTNNWNEMCHPIVHIHETHFSICRMVRALAFVFIDFRQGHNYWRLKFKSFLLHNFLCRLFSTVIPKNDVSKKHLFCILLCFAFAFVRGIIVFATMHRFSSQFTSNESFYNGIMRLKNALNFKSWQYIISNGLIFCLASMTESQSLQSIVQFSDLLD